MQTNKALLTLALLLGAPGARAAFQNPLVSPRAAAMGNASLASSYNDSAALYTNPAALGRMDVKDIYFTYNQLYAGLEGVGPMGQGFLSAAFPTPLGSFGVGVGDFRAAGLTEERTIAVGWATALSDRLQVGLSAKHLYHDYLVGNDPLAASDPVFADGTSRSAFGVDVGAIVSVTDRLQLGLAARNLNRPDVGLASEDKVPLETQAGAAYDFKEAGLKATADLLYRDGGSGVVGQKLTPSVGLEKSLDGRGVFLRLGASPNDFSAGFGLTYGRVGLDYALVFERNLVGGNYGTHRLGMRVQFGGPERPAEGGR